MASTKNRTKDFQSIINRLKKAIKNRKAASQPNYIKKLRERINTTLT